MTAPAGPSSTSSPAIKICGLNRPDMIRTAIEAGATHLGFVHFAPSPRHVDHADLARLADSLPRGGPAKVLLTVDADWPVLDAAVDPLAHANGSILLYPTIPVVPYQSCCTIPISAHL